MKTLNQFILTTCCVILTFGLSGCSTTSLVNQDMQYANPPWAPAYYPGTRYYYIPDLETYYDLSNQDFVYLDNGQWFFSRSLPPFYNGYDLYNGYMIALNRDIYQPWMHHQFYVSNYPRYYYQSIYNYSEIPYIRGFNENERKPVYRKQEERGRMNEPQPGPVIETNRRISRPQQNSDGISKSPRNSNEISRPPLNSNGISRPPLNSNEISRPPQNSNYYGRRIGQPVKVQPQMRENNQRDDGQRRDK